MVTPHTTTPPAEAASSNTLAVVGTRTEAIEAMTSLRWRIPGDTIQAAVKDLPEDERATVKWFAGYCRARNLGNTEAAQLLQKGNGTTYSWAAIYSVLTGRRAEQGVSSAPVIAAMDAFRKQVESESRLGESGFIRTRLAAAIYDRFDRARLRRKIAFVFGDSQIGKSATAIEYTREHNHGETIYLEAPSGGAITTLMQCLGDRLALPQIHRAGDFRDRIIASFDEKMLLIIDEAHRFLHAGRGIHSLDFLRELYNRAGCGMALLMTNEGRDIFRNGKHAKRLEQLWRRRLAPLQLPQTVPRDDLALFAAAYDLDPAGDAPVTVRTKYLDEHGRERERDYSESPLACQTRVVNEEGLGVWLTILQDAADMAKSQRRAITWAAVLKAYCVSQADAEVWS